MTRNLCTKNTFGVILFISYLLFCNSIFSQIIINEVCSSNDSILYDAEGDSPDWIEIFNNSEYPISLDNYFLSDNLGYLKKWQFPADTIEPLQYRLIYVSGKAGYFANEIHANFKLSSKGEMLIISNHSSEIIDSLSFGSSLKDYSFSRLPNISGRFRVCNFASPGLRNDIYPHAFVSHESGFYNADIELIFESFGDSVQLHYTLDGSEPTFSSNIYNAGLVISNRSLLPDDIALIPTTPMEGPDRLDYIIWKAPTMKCKRAHIVRFALFHDTVKSTPILTKTYFIHDVDYKAHALPVISIGVNQPSLFDYSKGIYIPGKRFDDMPWSYWPYGNYHYKGDDWERRINFEYFTSDGDLLFNSCAGMRMHGYSSATMAQKSFKLYFRKEYGQSSFKGKIFTAEHNEEHKRLIIRNGGNDFLKLHFRDALVQSLLEPIDIETQLFQPAVVYINGEYWGIHNIRQRFDDHYFNLQHNIPEDSLIIVGTCGATLHRKSTAYSELISFIKENDLSEQSNYEVVAKQIDVENCIQYYLAEIYFGNSDWPGNNYKMWKTTNPDSKWRWLIYDLDFSFAMDFQSQVYSNAFQRATVAGLSEWPSPDCATILLRNLLRNDEFKTRFLLSFQKQHKTIFKPELVIDKIDEVVGLYQSEMENHINRWHYPSSIEHWNDDVDVIKQFAQSRLEYLECHFKEYFGEIFYDSIIGIENKGYGQNVFLAYPNPTSSGHFTLEFFDNTKGNYKVQIFDIAGNKVFENRISQHLVKISVDLGDLSKGLYFISLENSSGIFKQKIVFN